MKRTWNALGDQDESGFGSPSKKIDYDDTVAASPEVTTQPWTQLFTSILGIDELYHENGAETNSNDMEESLSAAVINVDPEVSLGQPNIEEIGRRIVSWADVTMTQCAKAQRQEDVLCQMSIDETDDPEDDRMQCFGMIHKCRIRLWGDMQDLRNKLARINPSTTYAQLQFVTIPDTGFLRLQDGTLCAQLDHHLYDPLKRIAEIKSARLLAYAPVEGWIKIIDRARRHKSAETDIDINVYGLASVRAEIGQKLSEDGLYLQHIRHCEEDVEYENPHMLAYEDDDRSVHDVEMNDVDSITWKPKDVRQTILDVCLAETKERSFREYEGCVHVKVPLLLHQKQAVPFMVEREIGPIRDDAKLWRWIEDEERSGFRHLITDCWAAEPRQESGGGILADDPGMGKTLSTLCLIGQRLADAQTWSQLQEEDRKMNGRRSIRSKATLVVVPSLPIMAVWLKQIDTFTDGSLKILKYHGRFRCKQVAKMTDADIVFTTYHTLAVERKTKKSPLKSFDWFRIVLDEAHYIRKQATTFCAAVTELDACHRWCLTGTPIQNKLEDLGTLLAFIRASPLDNMSVFRKYIVAPFSYDLEGAREKLSLLLSSVCMRRRITRLNLPSIVERYHHVELSAAEKEQYNTTLNSMFWELSHGSREKYSGTPFGKFQIQLQLRRLCNHGTFQKAWVSRQTDLQAQREDVVSSMGKDGEVMCSSCHEPIPILLAYYGVSQALQSRPHILCDECENAGASGMAKAPGEDLARTVDEEFRSQPARSVSVKSWKERGVGFQGYSSKMNLLMQDVRVDLASTKSIIFSSWTSSLDLVQLHLQRSNVSYMRVDGNVEPSKRQSIFNAFENEESTKVLLMTTGTGAYGLNLTVANRVFILEPQWNPSIEVQAIARAQRMSQKKSVLVTRYIVRGTVEEDILRQQGSKLSIAEMGFRAVGTEAHENV